jgi:pyruvate, water dikinase
MNITDTDWQIYLSRPFNFLGASIWSKWYSGPITESVCGAKRSRALLIECPAGMVKHYVEKIENERFVETIKKTATENQIDCITKLKKGIELNKKAKEELEKDEHILSSKESNDFLIELVTYGTIYPYWVGDSEAVKNNEINALVTELRSVSFYPPWIEKVLIPLLQKDIDSSKSEIINFMTLEEIWAKDFSKAESRLKENKSGKTFIFQVINGQELIEYVDNAEEIVNSLEHTSSDTSEFKGTIACRGFKKGVVRVVLNKKVNEIIFDEGDILVAASTNPELLPIISKAGAIITDEGGMASHAAILSREFNIPCVIGTKIATKILNDGDMVEVDADLGIVRIIT